MEASLDQRDSRLPRTYRHDTRADALPPSGASSVGSSFSADSRRESCVCVEPLAFRLVSYVARVSFAEQLPGGATMSYVDGYVLAVANANKAAYQKLAEEMAPVFKKHGATSVVECWGDDVPDGKVTSLPMAVKCAEDETVVFSWIVWPDKEARDSGNKKVMEEVEASGMTEQDNPFDGQRMIFGGFDVMVDA